jgi:LacI family gluconate utilization system Gnt-I transcriptional repressor
VAYARTTDAKAADAIFFAGDVFGIGALLECQRRGLRVPGDIALASFDDYEISSQLTPHLTCLDIPRYRIGQEAARVLLTRSAAKDIGRERVNVGFSVLPNQTA